uniref:Uncharacterized protein LOC111113687 n=1 Tax=Crassostrea virginica TaxID=6565 RepID=A0A8B8BWL0_CRAVI|nr:uncharacterized protein LOC111113687 [Crassostrea virginica]
MLSVKCIELRTPFTIDQQTTTTFILPLMVTIAVIIVIAIFVIIKKRTQLLNEKVEVKLTTRKEIDLEDDFIARTDFHQSPHTSNDTLNVNDIWDIPVRIETSEIQEVSERLDISQDSSSLSIDNRLKGNQLHVENITDIKIHELQFAITQHDLENGGGFIREYEEQYKTIYLALNEEFKGSVDTKSVSAFKESIKHLFEEDPSVQVIFQKEFKTLSHIKPASTESDFRDATFDTENTEEKKALQLNENNLYLTPTVSNCGKFINATFASSFRQENAFILTEYPSQHDAVDFLRMLVDNNSNTIICMDPLADTDLSPTWLQFPSHCSMFGPFSLQHESDSEGDVKVTNIKILDGTGLAHPVKIVQPTGPLKSVQDTACLRSLVSYVMHIQRKKPITIVSK